MDVETNSSSNSTRSSKAVSKFDRHKLREVAEKAAKDYQLAIDSNPNYRVSEFINYLSGSSPNSSENLKLSVIRELKKAFCHLSAFKNKNGESESGGYNEFLSKLSPSAFSASEKKNKEELVEETKKHAQLMTELEEAELENKFLCDLHEIEKKIPSAGLKHSIWSKITPDFLHRFYGTRMALYSQLYPTTFNYFLENRKRGSKFNFLLEKSISNMRNQSFMTLRMESVAQISENSRGVGSEASSQSIKIRESTVVEN